MALIIGCPTSSPKTFGRKRILETEYLEGLTNIVMGGVVSCIVCIIRRHKYKFHLVTTWDSTVLSVRVLLFEISPDCMDLSYIDEKVSV